MRKHILIALSAIFLATSGVAFAYPDPTIAGWDNKSKYAQQAGQGGTRQTVTLVWVRYVDQAQNGASIVSGDAVVWSTVSDDGVSVTRSSASADGAFAGIAVVAIPTADTVQNSPFDGYGRRNWGWVLVHGKTVANITAGGAANCSAGDGFITSSDAGQISCLQNVSGTLNTTELNAVVRRNSKGGFVYDAPAAATDTSIEVQVEKE